MKLVVGLGNPGFRYRNTRHNVGFLVLKEMSKNFRIPLKKRKYNGLLGSGSVKGEKIRLFMPQTYMNSSGEAVAEIVKKNKIKLKELLVICDDIDLKFGSIRLKKKGSSAGHKGLQSIIERLQTSEFARLRIGIGRGGKISDVAGFVLNLFDPKERSFLRHIIKEAAKCAVTWIKEGPDRAMTGFNRRLQFP